MDNIGLYDIVFMVVLTYALYLNHMMRKILKQWEEALDGWKESVQREKALLRMLKRKREIND